MELELSRQRFLPHSTLGELRYGAESVCWVLEDAVREVPGAAVGTWKIPHETAIPVGRYRVVITPSARFKRLLPLLLSVPGFEGVRIHPGNTTQDTEGCLLPGRRYQTALGTDMVLESRRAFDACFWLIEDVLNRGEEVWLTVTGLKE